MTEMIYLLAGAALFALGAFRAFTSGDRVRRVIAANVMGNGVFLVLLTRAWSAAGDAGTPDPVPHALVLTGIVVAAAATGLALSIAGRLDEDEER